MNPAWNVCMRAYPRACSYYSLSNHLQPANLSLSLPPIRRNYIIFSEEYRNKNYSLNNQCVRPPLSYFLIKTRYTSRTDREVGLALYGERDRVMTLNFKLTFKEHGNN